MAASAISIVLISFVAVLATRPSASSLAAQSPLIGRPVPDVQASTVDGTPFRLSSLAGRWVVINFFATWCVACRQEQPDLANFAAEHKFLGDADLLGRGLQRHRRGGPPIRGRGGTWPMLQDANGQILLAFGVRGVPETFVVAPDGTVVAKFIGAVRVGDLDQVLSRASASRPAGSQSPG